MSELYLRYGECPTCGDMCQPDCVGSHPCDEEWVTCCECEIIWTLYHDDPTIPRDGSNPSQLYRIGEVESFEAWGDTPYECKDR